MSLRTAVLLAGLLPLAALAPSAAAASAEDLCPAVKVNKESGRLAVYPGGAPGHNKLDYAFIAVVLSATAVCHEDDRDRIVADVTYTFALQPGSLYQGSASVELFANVVSNGEVVGDQISAKKIVNPAKDSGALTLSVTATGLVVGTSDALEAGGLSIAGGFVKQAVAP